MQFGIFDHFDRAATSLHDQYENRLRIAERYDEIGIRSYHMAEHHGTPLGMSPSPNLFMAALAQRTKRLRFGPLVYCLPLYHPIRLIEEICMLDQMSGGRLEVGVGRGISKIEVGYFGLEYEEAPPIYREAYQLILEGLTNDELTFKGDHFQVDGMTMEMRPLQQPHPPLWYGVHFPDAAVWPAQNGLNVIANNPAASTREISDRYREEWETAGNDPADMPLFGMSRFMVIADTTDEARDIARRAYPVWHKSFMKLWVKYNAVPPNVIYADNFDAVEAAGQAIVGSPDEVADKIRDHYTTAGVNYFVCRFAFGDLSVEETLRSTDLLGAEVMPKLADIA